MTTTVLESDARETLKTVLIKRLAALDPMVESYQGNIDCFFCGTWEGEEHNPDCIWMLAKKLEEE